jgi:hypothetical protein
MDHDRWDTHREACCRSIARRRATLKILLKTKDDPFLLERWILHHRKIVGPDNLVIFDNMSTHPEVIRVYEKYSNAIQTISYPKFHNSLHDVSACPELYDTLRDASRFFIFLDTDEFLILIDDDRYYDDEGLVDFLGEQDEADVHPATWLPNADWRASRFRCGDDFDGLAGGIAWGKPILRAKAGLSGFINHNAQLHPSLFAKPFRTNFFVLHLKHLFPEQRIAANVAKLKAFGFAAPEDSPEAVARRSLDGITNENAIRYVIEIRKLMAVTGHRPADTALGAGCLELLDDHGIGYYGKKERALLRGLIDDPVPTFSRALLRAGFMRRDRPR